LAACTPPTELWDMSDQRDRDESAEPIEAKDPTENSEQALPIDPIERNDPTDPIDKDRALRRDGEDRALRADRPARRRHGGVVAHQGDRCGGNRGSASYSSP